MMTAAGSSVAGDTAFAAAAGRQPLIKAWEYTPQADDPAGYAIQLARAKAHHAAGGIVGMSAHLKNYATGRSFYDRQKDDTATVASMLPGGANRAAFLAGMDALAATLTTDLVDASGKLIPVKFRFFHEMNGFFDYPTKAVASMTASAGVVTVTTTAPHGWGVGTTRWAQQVGAAPAAVAGAQFITATGASTYTFNGSTVTTPATGVYECSGFWWTGRDRQGDTVKLFRDAIDYLRNTKGCHNLIVEWNMYPYDGTNYISTNPNGSDAYGSWVYDPWYPGGNVIDSISLDYYDRSASVGAVSMANTTLALTAAGMRQIAERGGKLWGLAEIGFDHAGREKAGFWTADVLTPVKSTIKGCFLGLWDQNYVPVSGDAAYASFQAAMADPVMRHLGDA